MDIYETLNNVPTHLIVWGDPFNNNSDTDVIVIVPGCPGIPEFYREFGAELHENTKLSVCIIGHAGHGVPPAYSRYIQNKEFLYNVEGQLCHKLDLLNNYINQRRKLHLIGHSSGSWLVVELLDRNKHLTGRISSVNLLFPTLQKIAETWNGKLVNLIRKFHHLTLFLLQLIQLLPKAISYTLVRLYLIINALPLRFVERILYMYLNPEIEKYSLLLAYEIIDSSSELNRTAIDKIKHLTNVVYSAKDSWTPKGHIDDLKTFEPHMCVQNINVEHAFVLKSATVVAKIVAKFIKTKLV